MQDEDEIKAEMVEKYGEPPKGLAETEKITFEAVRTLNHLGVNQGIDQLVAQERFDTLVDILAGLGIFDYWDFHLAFHARLQTRLQDTATDVRRHNLANPGSTNGLHIVQD